MIVKLTNVVIAAAKPGESPYCLWDEGLPSFGVRVNRDASKTFLVHYRAEGGGRAGRQREKKIGRVGEIGLPQARRAAEKILAEVKLGGDPAGDLAAKRREMKVAGLIDLYEAEGCVVQRGLRQGQPMKPDTKTFTLARLRNHVVPLLGHRRVAELTAGDVEKLVRDIAQGKTAQGKKGDGSGRIVKGGDGAARKVARDFSAVLSFAQRRKIIAANPVATAAVRKTDNRRERYLTGDEIKRLGAALDDLETGHTLRFGRKGQLLDKLNPTALTIIRLWALTGCRRNEITGLKWSEVDLQKGLLTLDDSKTGRSIRPLSAPAVALLEKLAAKADPDDRFVFPGERGNSHFQGTKGVWAEVARLAGLSGVTPHTLRHTVGAHAASNGESLLMVGHLLGHSNARSTQIYAHVDQQPGRLAANRTTAVIADALGVPIPVAANGAPLPKAANDG